MVPVQCRNEKGAKEYLETTKEKATDVAEAAGASLGAIVAESNKVILRFEIQIYMHSLFVYAQSSFTSV